MIDIFIYNGDDLIFIEVQLKMLGCNIYTVIYENNIIIPPHI